MPHIVVEYSVNLEEQISAGELVRRVHEAALGTAVFEVGAVRTRGEPRQLYEIADGDPENAFIHVAARIAPGRDPDTRRRIGQALLDALWSIAEPIWDTTPLGLSVEVNEIDDTAALRKNNLQEHVAAKRREMA